jgi:hypothetical protein
MLTNMLPGLREVRAPLIAGYILFGAIFLYVAPSYTSAGQLTHHYSELGKLATFLGRVGLVAVLSVLCFLVGSLVVSFSQFVFWVLPAQRREARRALYGPESAKSVRMTKPTVVQIRQIARAKSAQLVEQWQRSAVARELGDRQESSILPAFRSVAYRESAGPPSPETDHLDDDEIERSLVDDLLRAPLKERLLASEKDVYSEIDRQDSEAELRESIILPAFVLLPALLLNIDTSVIASIAFSLGYLLLLAFLFMEARSRRIKSTTMLVNAVANGLLSTPTLDVIDEVIQRLPPREQ